MKQAPQTATAPVSRLGLALAMLATAFACGPSPARSSEPPDPRVAVRSGDRTDPRAATQTLRAAWHAFASQVCKCEPGGETVARFDVCMAEFDRQTVPPWTPCHDEAVGRQEALVVGLYDCYARALSDPNTCPTAACIQGCRPLDSECADELPCARAMHQLRECERQTGADGLARLLERLAACDPPIVSDDSSSAP